MSKRHQVLQIAISSIAVAERLRTIRPDTVDALAQSMTDQGQLQPIIVRSRKDGGYWVVAGLHRLEAAKKLKWTEINCTVFGEMEADEAELAEIDENLVRADLSPAERALHIGKRKELHEKVHGKAKANSARAAAVGRRDIDDIINVIEPRRGFDTLKQAWNAATPYERLMFATEYYDEISTMGPTKK